MKFKHRALALILSVAMMLTFMPAMAFAEDAAEDAEQPVAAEEQAAPAEETAPAEAIDEGAEEAALESVEDMEAAGAPVKAIEYSGTQLCGYIGSREVNNLYQEGNSVTFTYNDNSKKTFTYVDWDDENSIEPGFYLNGNNKDERLDGDLQACSDGIIVEGNNKGFIEFNYYGDIDAVFNVVRSEITVLGVASDEIASMTYTQKNPITIPYGSRWKWKDNDNVFEGDTLTINYKNGETRKYVNTASYNEEDKETYYNYECKVSDGQLTWTEYVCPEYVTNKDPYDWEQGETGTVSVYLDGVKASGSITINVKKILKPIKAEIVQTEPAYALIGAKYLYPYALYGEGNKIKITYDDNSVKEYTYQKYDGDNEYGFYWIGEDGEFGEVWPEINLSSRVAKGDSTVSGKMEVLWNGPGEISLPVSVKVSASQYLAEVSFKTYQYTGKKITPKVTVKYWNGKKFKTMPKKWYTCKPKKNKKIGRYEFQVKIKKKYQSMYGDVIYGEYEIAPKKPTISKAKAGSDSITVSWKKFSKKDQKMINGFIVQYSTNKKFPEEDTEWDWVDNKRASSYKIRGLDKGKKYYIRVCSYKEAGESSIKSNPSKTKSATVK